MSELLDAIIEERRKGALDYKAYLDQLIEHATKLGKRESDTQYPNWANDGGKKALIDFFNPDSQLALEVDHIVRRTKRDAWVGNPIKEKQVRRALMQQLPADFDRTDDLMALLKARHEYQ